MEETNTTTKISCYTVLIKYDILFQDLIEML